LWGASARYPEGTRVSINACIWRDGSKSVMTMGMGATGAGSFFGGVLIGLLHPLWWHLKGFPLGGSFCWGVLIGLLHPFRWHLKGFPLGGSLCWGVLIGLLHPFRWHFVRGPPWEAQLDCGSRTVRAVCSTGFWAPGSFHVALVKWPKGSMALTRSFRGVTSAWVSLSIEACWGVCGEIWGDIRRIMGCQGSNPRLRTASWIIVRHYCHAPDCI
jgi:hypothetical protein